MDETRRINLVLDKEAEDAIDAILETYDVKPSRSAVIREGIMCLARQKAWEATDKPPRQEDGL